MQVIITGGSAGLGLALVRLAAAAGHEVLAVGRRPAAEVAGGLPSGCRYLQADLASAGGVAAVAEAVAAAGAAWERLDRLVHNAAIGRVADIGEHTLTDITEQIAINLRAPIALTQALLPRLHAAEGQVMFVSSTAVRRPQPKFPVYTATKAGLDAFARNLRTETRGRLTVSTHHPGPLRTDFHARAGMSKTPLWRLFKAPEREAAKLARQLDLEAAA